MSANAIVRSCSSACAAHRRLPKAHSSRRNAGTARRPAKYHGRDRIGKCRCTDMKRARKFETSAWQVTGCATTAAVRKRRGSSGFDRNRPEQEGRQMAAGRASSLVGFGCGAGRARLAPVRCGCERGWGAACARLPDRRGSCGRTVAARRGADAPRAAAVAPRSPSAPSRLAASRRGLVHPRDGLADQLLDGADRLAVDRRDDGDGGAGRPARPVRPMRWT